MADLTPIQRWDRRIPGLYWLTHPKTVILTHHGIAMIDARGAFFMLDSTPERGPNWTNFEAFADGNPVTVAAFKDLSFLPLVMARFKKYLAEHPSFDLATSNCEHFVNSLWNGKHESGQVKVAAGAAAAALLVAIILGD